ncbi:MAG: HypC/HybG/HupF family hydrogenase formation chaperone [Candidatus Doudnabacteria bacterium]
MCLTIPQKIIGLKKNKAINEQGKTLDASLVSIKTGDWVLEQNGIIIKKISEKQTKDILNLMFNNFAF